ncbi:MAG: bifunctional nuclease family protein [Blastocatellia bacterium]
MELEMRIRGLLMDPTTNSPIVILKDVQSETMLPIWVGPFEANSIASEIEKIAPPRPMTHDLLRNLVNLFGAEVRRIIVTELRENTFYAVIEIDWQGEHLTLDARPSDAIALALRADCPIFVNEEVVKSSQNAGLGETDDIQAFAGDEEEVEWPDELGDISDYKM